MKLAGVWQRITGSIFAFQRKIEMKVSDEQHIDLIFKIRTAQQAMANASLSLYRIADKLKIEIDRPTLIFMLRSKKDYKRMRLEDQLKEAVEFADAVNVAAHQIEKLMPKD